MKNLRVFEAFSGYGSQSIALKNIGVSHEVVGISEIDTYALKAYAAIHGDCKNFGDISKLDTTDIPDHDLLTYSFPCQDISMSGKQRGFKIGSGTRSSLLWECQRIIEVKKPNYLLMENVKNLISKKHKPYFDEWCKWLTTQGYTNYYTCLNAKDFGIPQNRERIFMVSILGCHKQYSFPTGFPLKYTLKDFLDKNVPEKYYLSEDIQKRFTEKFKQSSIEDFHIKNGAIRGRYNEKGIVEQNLELRHDNCTNTITTVQKDNVIIEPTARPIGLLDIKGFVENRKVYSEFGLAPTLTTMQGGNRQPKVIETKNGYRIRKLTEGECGRLMGVSEYHIEKIKQQGISASQQYKMFGNSIVIPVLEAIFKNLFIDYMIKDERS